MIEAVQPAIDVRLTAELRRRDEILDTASALFASRGLRISLEEIAGACGIKPGSLYHHFESKEAIVIELIQRYHAALDHLAEVSMDHDGARTTGDPIDRVIALATAIAACASRHSAAW